MNTAQAVAWLLLVAMAVYGTVRSAWQFGAWVQSRRSRR